MTANLERELSSSADWEPSMIEKEVPVRLWAGILKDQNV
jgi:hypothetical protein